MITATELLKFLYKAQQVSSPVTFTQDDKGYYIRLCCDWYDNNEYHHRIVFIDNKGNSGWNTVVDWDFSAMNIILDTLIEKQQEKEIKAQKRKELIQSLTPEQRELLGV